MSHFTPDHALVSPSLLDAIAHPDNLLLAWERVLHKHGAAGVDGITVEDFAVNFQGNLMVLHEGLATATYQPDPLLVFQVDKGNGESRTLMIPTVRDRVAQQAIRTVLTELLDPTFAPCSYGYRRGKGRKQALEAMIHLRDQGHQHILHADIQDFFESVDHSILLQLLAEHVQEEEVLHLVRRCITAQVSDGYRVESLTQGLPQGSSLSPLLSNLYLDPFDKLMLERGYTLIRYVDDFVVLVRERAVADQALQFTHYLLNQLRLCLNPSKTELTTFDAGVSYLGAWLTRSEVFTKGGDTLRVGASSVGGTSSTPQRLRTQSSGEDSHLDTFSLQSEDTNVAPPFVVSPTDTPASIPTGDPDPRQEGNGMSHEPWISQQLRSMEAAIQQLRSELMANSDTPESDPIPLANTDDPRRACRLLTTLYIQEQGCTLSCSQKRFVVTKGDDTLLEVPVIKVGQIVLLGRCHVTTPVIHFCLKAGIPICFLSSHGRYYGRLAPPTSRQVELQRMQFERCADERFAFRMAKAHVEGKIHNQRVFLQKRNQKNRDPQIATAVQFLGEHLESALRTTSLSKLRGYEGTCSAQYFQVFDNLLDGQFTFAKRVKFPPTDPVNAMLSFGYTLLFQNIYSLVEAHGLHPYCGHLHALRDGHPALVSDLIEEFRTPIVDSLVTYLVNSRIVTPDDFEQKQDAGKSCLLNSEARKRFVQHFETKMQSAITHPHTGYRVDYRRCLDLQVIELAQCIRGEREDYRPMKARP